ncbi:hypothetical protein [Streptomyces albogriseolus]
MRPLRISRIRASGEKGLPLTMPTAASAPAISGSSASAGWSCTSSLARSKYVASPGGTVFMGSPEPSTKRGGSGLRSAAVQVSAVHGSGGAVPPVTISPMPVP